MSHGTHIITGVLKDCNKPEDSNLQRNRCKNIKSRITATVPTQFINRNQEKFA